MKKVHFSVRNISNIHQVHLYRVQGSRLIPILQIQPTQFENFVQEELHPLLKALTHFKTAGAS